MMYYNFITQLYKLSYFENLTYINFRFYFILLWTLIMTIFNSSDTCILLLRPIIAERMWHCWTNNPLPSHLPRGGSGGMPPPSKFESWIFSLFFSKFYAIYHKMPCLGKNFAYPPLHLPPIQESIFGRGHNQNYRKETGDIFAQIRNPPLLP